LAQPRLGDRQPKEELGERVGGRAEGLVEGVVSVLQLLVDELAADLMVGSQCGDGLTGEGVEGELLPCRRRQRLCGAGGVRGRVNGGRAR
jgi:hypothetical protein